MERESFEDDEVAKILNDHFVSIKVDREERPDIDHIYMSVCQALTGHGGWPLTVFLTPDKEPFFAGTYFPKTRKYGHTGLLELLVQIAATWEQKRDKLLEAGTHITQAIQNLEVSSSDTLELEIIHEAFRKMEKSFDKTYGGFGKAPKFPTPHNLSLLLRYYKVMENEKALEMVEKTLESMYKGGIFDHVGFGFSRYSTDQKWLVPHFEKMLYDNALLAIAYTETYLATDKEFYKDVANKIFHYVLRDMVSPECGFYCAEDADSEGVEGKFYVWTKEEIFSILGEEDGAFYCKYYDISKQGNFEGHNIPNFIGQDLNKLQDIDLREKLTEMNVRLFQVREKRVHPHKDDKILTSWNGLMMAALAYAGRSFGNPSYVKAAQNAAHFIDSYLRREDGRLLARYRDGDARHLAYLDDYAFLIWGLIEIYEASFDAAYLARAMELTQDMIRLFWDEEHDGLFLYGKDQEQLLIRPKDVYDGALPSGNSVAALNLLRLGRMTGNGELEEKARRLFHLFGGSVKQAPHGFTHFLMAFLFAESPTKEIVLAGDCHDPALQTMLQKINSRFLPHTVIIHRTEDQALYQLIPFIKEQGAINEQATAYVCENFACQAPTTDISEFVQKL